MKIYSLLLKSFIVLLFVSLCTLGNTQVIENEFIVTVKENQVDRFSSVMNNDLNGLDYSYRILSKDLGIVLIKATTENFGRVRELIENNSMTSSWGYNHKTKKRKSPNDQYYDMQWGLELIEASQAWEVTTGGTDLYGREIVVAVLDDGFHFDHPELEGVFLTNSAETPDDNIDNDNNGYVDDYLGWNAASESDSHPLSDNHGIAVSGIIGAKGDNEEGISGINWNIKILPLSGIGTQAEVIAAYQYALDMRRRYNETDGEEGAFIVTVNYSAGIDNRFGTEPAFESWCNMYDALAEVGILSVGATTNKNTNVDQDGDIPTTCPSEYLIAVTNVEEGDIKVPRAGYGALNIDLGAPGKGTLALNINQGYDQDFGGTSASTPHVAGTIALLYSIPCKAIADMALDNPKMSIEIIRDAIYDGVDANSTLDGITSTGGRLNIFGAMEKLQEVCEELLLPSPTGPLEILKIKGSASQGELNIEYITPDNNPYFLMITDRSGKVIERKEFTPPTFGRKVLNIDARSFPTGIYFISIYNDSNISTEKRFENN